MIPTEFNPSNAISHDVADALEVLQQFTADVAAQGVAAPRVRRPPAFVEQFPAIIRSSPCASNVTADYADARYYVDRAVPMGGSSGAAISVQTDELPGARQCLTATNLAELAGGTHLLPAGTIVQVFALCNRQGTKQYIFNQPTIGGVVVQITGPASGGGKYNGLILEDMSSATSAGNLAMPEGMSGAAGALVLNVEETGQSGHRIANGAYAVGEVVGDNNGTAVVMIRGALGATTPLTGLGDGTGGSLSADSTSWSRTVSGTAVAVWLQTRTLWDPAAGTLYAYLRSLTFDARGVLVSISGENQITVDVAMACE